MLKPSARSCSRRDPPKRDVLEDRHVERREARADERVARHVAERARRRQREAVRIEVLVRAAEHRIRRAAGDEIRPLPGAARARQRARAIEAEHRRERNARAHRQDARQLPAGRQSRATSAASATWPNGSSHVELKTKLWRMSKSDSPLFSRRIDGVARLEAVVEVAAADRLRARGPRLAQRVGRLHRQRRALKRRLRADDEARCTRTGRR